MKGLRQQLPEGQVILSFFAMRGTLYGFALTRDGLQAWRIPGALKVRTAIATLLRSNGPIRRQHRVGLQRD